MAGGARAAACVHEYVLLASQCGQCFVKSTAIVWFYTWQKKNHISSPYIFTSNKNFILKYFRCSDGKRTETRIGMEGICITHSCIPLYTVYMQHIMAHSGGMQEWVIQIPSIPILVSVLYI